MGCDYLFKDQAFIKDQAVKLFYRYDFKLTPERVKRLIHCTRESIAFCEHEYHAADNRARDVSKECIDHFRLQILVFYKALKMLKNQEVIPR